MYKILASDHPLHTRTACVAHAYRSAWARGTRRGVGGGPAQPRLNQAERWAIQSTVCRVRAFTPGTVIAREMHPTLVRLNATNRRARSNMADLVDHHSDDDSYNLQAIAVECSRGRLAILEV